ncbi:PAS domain-containing protein|uniref:PAS domain-containing protein n=1 Tax=Noviherbaspirillum sp. L7-7A TaxID=2850560 RepID=UPI001C2C1535|nr:PAS domain-containing protein [Noviherbaspirillum sp. L7-7A]MBV0880387.1 PAS domain-containing protein [Noviherbaspirillum sp. L7-7A]
MTQLAQYAFAQPELLPILTSASPELLDSLDFGLIGFDADGMVRQYNAFESRAAGLSPQRVLGQSLFTHVAPCMNNFMVAQRFEDAAGAGSALDDTIDYVLTLRMRPVKVKLRLLSAPAQAMRYVLIQRAL